MAASLAERIVTKLEELAAAEAAAEKTPLRNARS